MQTFTGPIEKVVSELVKINPTYLQDYKIPNATEARMNRANNPRSVDGFEQRSSLEARDKFGFTPSCTHRWTPCDAWIISDGVIYLRGVKGKPKNGPGPGNCGRVSCSYNSAIYWCNDVRSFLPLHVSGETNRSRIARRKSSTHSTILLMVLILFCLNVLMALCFSGGLVDRHSIRISGMLLLGVTTAKLSGS